MKKGKIIAWAWLSRGLVSPEQITEWLHDGDFELFKKSMQKVMSFVSKECIHMYIRPSHFDLFKFFKVTPDKDISV